MNADAMHAEELWGQLAARVSLVRALDEEWSATSDVDDRAGLRHRIDQEVAHLGRWVVTHAAEIGESIEMIAERGIA